jgi:NAD(P)-dependent dehydrogenase (short-subunit alcohol dehydrogenase family)
MLRGKTLFITGASRGIGKAIGIRAAKDGASVVVAAKTASQHAKLEGTIFSAAQEIEAAGGQALAVQCDIRNEAEVAAAVSQAVERFNGIDVLVNNASAISLTGTEATDMKRYDLMHAVNGRGTFLATKTCLPHLKASGNGHILTISPPLNLNPRWFKNHVAYTTAKYNMSMNALGWAEELRSARVASNCLWPRTGIATAAMRMLVGEDDANKHCRTVDIMADAAHIVLTRDAATCTGNFFIDDEVILEAEPGADLERYSCVPGSRLMPDFFLDGADVDFAQAAANEPVAASAAAAEPAAGTPIDKLFGGMQKALDKNGAKLVASIGCTYRFDIADAQQQTQHWFVDLTSGSGSIDKRAEPAAATCVVEGSADTFAQIASKQLSPQAAFFGGKLKISGDMTKALQLAKIL